MSINIKPINELAGKVSDLMCEPVASSLEEAQAWDKNPHLKLSKYSGHNIQLPENEINEAIEVWNEIEKIFIGILKKNFNQTMHDFIQNYKNIREALINKKIDGNTIIEISKYRSITYEVVWNISWIDLFVWQLPKINLNDSSKYISIAERMLAIKYIETLNKNSSLLFDYAELFPFIRNLEARAKLLEDKGSKAMNSRKENFKIGTFHGKLNPAKSNSEAKLRNDLYLIGSLTLELSRNSKINVKIIGYEIPLDGSQKRGMAIDLFGYDKEHKPYIIELKKAETSEDIALIINQINNYEKLLLNSLDGIEKEIQEKYHWNDFKFSGEIQKIILVDRNYFKNKQLPSFNDVNIYICSFSRISDIYDNDGNVQLLKLRASEGNVNLKIENKS